MSAARDFSMMARGVRVFCEPPKVTYKGKPTFMRICIRCGNHQPHVLVDGKYQCVVCGPTPSGLWPPLPNSKSANLDEG